MNDAELVRDVLAGHTDRFGALVSRYIGLVRGLCAAHVKDGTAQDDLAQESFVHAYTKLASLRDGSRFAPWLCTIVRNKCMDWLRRNRRSQEMERAVAAEPAPQVATPEDALMGEELRDWVRGHIARLPDRTREAMFLCYVEGLAQRDAARFLGISISALKKRLQYGRESIGERIWNELEDQEQPKRDDAELAGVIMAAVHTANAPVAASGAIGTLAAFVAAHARFLAFGAAALMVGAGVAIYTPSALDAESRSTPEPATPEASVVAAESEPALPVRTVPPAANSGVLATAILEQAKAEVERRGIDGVVIMKDTKAPVADVEVALLTYTENSGLQPSDSATTRADGTFAFPNVDPETEFSLQLGWPNRYVLADPFSRTWGGGPQPDHYVLEAHTVGAITGHVRTPDGEPIANALIIRTFPFGYRSHQYAQTDADGRFGFSQDGGTWRLQAQGRMGNDSEVVVLDVAQGDVVEQDFVLPRGASIRLDVRDPAGAVPSYIFQVEVNALLPELLDSGEPKERTTYSNESLFVRNGDIYTLPLLREGTYTISLQVPGFVQAVAGPFVIDSKFEDQYAKVVLEPEAPEVDGVTHAEGHENEVEPVQLDVAVQDGLGNPLDEAGLFFFAIDETGEPQDDNPYTLVPGTYWTAAVKEGYGADIRYQVVSEESKTLAFTLADGGTIHGTIAQAGETDLAVLPFDVWESIGQPAGQKAIKSDYRKLGDALAQGTKADANNAFVLPGLPDGLYVVMTDTLASEPVQVRSGYATGPVRLAPEPAVVEE